MGHAITQGLPVGEIVKQMVPPGTTNPHLPVYVDKVSLSAEGSPSNGGMLSWQNPLGVKCFAAVILDVTTPATGAANADIGVGSSAATDDDTLLDGVDIGSAAGEFNSATDAGTNGSLFRKVDENGGTNDWVAGTASADSSGLVGSAYIVYIPAE